MSTAEGGEHNAPPGPMFLLLALNVLPCCPSLGKTILPHPFLIALPCIYWMSLAMETMVLSFSICRRRFLKSVKSGSKREIEVCFRKWGC